ncbi:LuxR C-terminal-related transcriptional regulator [Streptomyces sp. CRN 30]|uniref:LuxR C-terminal-related transcriptional regulator n=1 Tax=Streptomyces sp. CRN 30 TaxID=3075613 RepID=UPI002A81EE5A|nr:LuxR C-terminal-related transcriptional regulator [Streptomyces sp. CRN 30]
MERTCSGTCEATDLCAAGLALYERTATAPDRAEPRAPGTTPDRAEPLIAGEVPACLHRLGLVVPCADGPDLVRIVPPSVAAAHRLAPLERAITRRRTELAAATEAFALIEDAYRRARASRAPDVTLVRGGKAVDATVRRALDECRTDLVTAQPGPGRSPEILAGVLERDLPALRRGVRKRVIYQHTIRTHGPTLEYIDSIVREGAEARTLSEPLDRLMIFDRRVAYAASPVPDELVEIHQPALVHFLGRSFERAWNRATPVPTTEGYRRSVAVTSDLQRSIMRMLVQGFTEERIARELGMGRRTVAEHTSRLSQRFGSSSRAQLGYAIAKSGLLD